jgi:hypothetical protein
VVKGTVVNHHDDRGYLVIRYLPPVGRHLSVRAWV